MGCSTYFIISLILFSSLVLSPVSAATGELPRLPYGKRDSKIPYPDPYPYPGRDPDIDPFCNNRRRRRQVFCPPPTTAPTKP